MNGHLMNPPPPSSNAIADAIAVLEAVQDPAAQKTFLQSVVAQAEAKARAVLDSANAVMAAASNSQQECDRQCLEVAAERASLNDSFDQKRAALDAEHAAKIQALDKQWQEATDWIKLGKAAKEKYEKLTADLRARVAA